MCCMTCGDDYEYMFRCYRCRITFCSFCHDTENVEHLDNCPFAE
jgi:hypothetical protein